MVTSLLPLGKSFVRHRLAFFTEQDLDGLRRGIIRYPRVMLATGETRLVDASGWLYVGRRTLGGQPFTQPPCPIQIERAFLALRTFNPEPVQTKGANICSYNFKHVLERLIGDYISNGAGIVAAYRAGIVLHDFRPYPELNAKLAISRKWYRLAERTGSEAFSNRFKKTGVA